MTTFPTVTLSDPAELDLIGYRGDSGSFRVTVTEAGAPLDVSAAAWDCDVRATPDGALLATLDVVPVAGMTNAVDVVLTAEQSALIITPTDPDKPDVSPPPAVWDLEMTLGTAPDTTTTTLLRGTFTVTADVSRPPLAPLPEGGGPAVAAVPAGIPPSPLAGAGLTHTGPDRQGPPVPVPTGPVA